jgi:hypothetical protein
VVSEASCRVSQIAAKSALVRGIADGVLFGAVGGLVGRVKPA